MPLDKSNNHVFDPVFLGIVANVGQYSPVNGCCFVDDRIPGHNLVGFTWGTYIPSSFQSCENNLHGHAFLFLGCDFNNGHLFLFIDSSIIGLL